MTKEEFEYLERFDTNFSTAVNDDYSRNIMRADLERMKKIYDNETGMDYSLSYSCGACQLAFLQRLGRIYFREKASRVAKELEPVLNDNELQDVATNKDKKAKKNGRRKTNK